MALSFKRIRFRVRRMLRSIISMHGSPRDIALGTAIGVFVAFTPTIAFQMLISAFLATLLGANRPAAIIPPWITNPLTIPPVFALTYWIGTFFQPGPSVGEVYHQLGAVVESLGKLSFYAFYAQMAELLKVGAHVFVPMMIGGVIVGAICAAVAYPLTLRAVMRYRLERQRRRERRALRAAQEGSDGQPDA